MSLTLKKYMYICVHKYIYIFFSLFFLPGNTGVSTPAPHLSLCHPLTFPQSLVSLGLIREMGMRAVPTSFGVLRIKQPPKLPVPLADLGSLLLIKLLETEIASLF